MNPLSAIGQVASSLTSMFTGNSGASGQSSGVASVFNEIAQSLISMEGQAANTVAQQQEQVHEAMNDD